MKAFLLRAAGALFLLLVGGAAPGRAEYALRDGDRVVFLGDSITAARRYDRVIENYTLLRFPGRRVQFFNAGKGGDTAEGGLQRLERDVFSRDATVVIVAFGTNDIGWGVKADEEHKQKYLAGIRGIVEECNRRKVRVFICSEPITNEAPDKAEKGFLQRMCDEGLELARSLGAGTIDVQRPMREVQRRVLAHNKTVKDAAKHTRLHVADGVHLNELGHLAMAYAILKGLGAPAEVSAVTIDAKGPEVVAAEGCKVSGLRGGDAIEFDRLDEGWPVNFGTFGALNFWYIPFPSELGRYMLAVNNLDAGSYEVLAGGRKLGKFTAKQLAAGMNISFSTADAWEPGGPWDAQAAALSKVTDARYEITGTQWYAEHFMTGHPALDVLRADMARTVEQLESLQRAIAKPVPVRFVIRRLKADQ
jgi:lysophospholipase L1-like esterase